MLRHRVDGCVQFLLNHHHILLILLCNQIDRQSYLPETTAAANSVQICRRVFREVKIYDNVDAGNINTSRNKVGTDQSFKLPLPEPFKDFQSLVFHVRCQILVFESLAFHLFRKKLGSFVGSTKNNALIHYQFAIDFVQILQLLRFLHENIVVG